VTSVARSVSPVSTGRLSLPLRLLLFAVVGIAIYFVVMAAFLPGGSATAAQQVANALTLGAIYALVALGYTMVYGIIELINFAHGDVFMVGSFIALYFVSGPLGQTGEVSNPALLAALLLATFAVAMTAMGLINVTIERFAYRPLRHAPRLAPLITAIGVSLILQNIVQIIVGTGDRPVAQIFPNVHVGFLGADIRGLSLFIFIVALLLMYLLQLFVSRTRLGRAMGVDLNTTIAITFLIGGALAGAAGVFHSQYFGFVRFDLGFNAGLKAFTAAVLGGIGNLTGAALGGFLIAFIEVFSQAVGQARWSQAIVFVVLIVVLVFRPAGILGQQIGERA
jgi:branched-chain amino acid transport system permease protein